MKTFFEDNPIFVEKELKEDLLQEQLIGNRPIKASLLEAKDIDRKLTYRFIKRMIDIIGSVLGLVILIPLFIIIAIALKMEDKNAPILFSQIRIGKNRKEFKMYKFRSMCVGAEKLLDELLEHNEIEGAMFKIKEDPRVTKVGQFIRKTSIDELPQFYNVLKGDMSLVGPRPPLIREVAEYSTYDKQRLLVKPGCAGVWQISGRNNVNFYDMVEMDIEYIKHLSIINDMKIIAKTAWIMIKPNGAY